MHISCKKCHSRSGITCDLGFLLEIYWKSTGNLSGWFSEVSGHSFIDGTYGNSAKIWGGLGGPHAHCSDGPVELTLQHYLNNLWSPEQCLE